MIQNSRRTFIKGALVAGGVVATASVSFASKNKDNGGVVSGKSRKKETLYKRTQEWDEYYKAAH